MKIAVIAHAGKKDEMVKFFMDYITFFNGVDIGIIANGTTGYKVMKVSWQVECGESGPKGGNAQIDAQVTDGKEKMVLYYRGSLDKHSFEDNINKLMHLSGVHFLPPGTNPAATELMLKGFTPGS